MNRRAPIIVGAVVLALIVLVTLLLVMPKSGQVGDAEESLATAQNTQAQLEIQLEELQTLRDSAPQFQRQLDEDEQLMPPTADKQGLIRSLQLVASNSDVDFTVLSVNSPQLATAGDFSTIGLSINVSGDFFQIAQYLFDLENLKERAIKVTTVSLAPAAWPQLTATLGAEAYTTDTAAGPGSEPGPQGTEAAPEA